MHVRDGVVNVEIVLYVHGVHELPGVDVQKETRKHGCRLDQRTFLPALEGTSVSHPGEGTPHLGGLLNIHVGIHTFEGLVQVEGSETGLGCPEVLGVIHPVVGLILMLIQI